MDTTDIDPDHNSHVPHKDVLVMDNILEELKRTKAETLTYFELAESDLEKRSAPGKWTVKEILHHICDAETVLYDRIRRIISQPRPLIWAFDQEAWAAKLGYADRPYTLSSELYAATRNSIIHYAELHYKESDALEFVHSELGVRTLRQEFDKVVEHNDLHLKQIRKALENG